MLEVTVCQLTFGAGYFSLPQGLRNSVFQCLLSRSLFSYVFCHQSPSIDFVLRTLLRVKNTGK